MRSFGPSRNINIKRGFPRLNKPVGPWSSPSRRRQEPWHIFLYVSQRLKVASTKLLHFARHYHLHYAALLILISLCMLQAALLAINGARSDSPIIGLHFHGQNITRYNRQQITVLAHAAIHDAEKHPVSLRLDNNILGTITPRQLGARYTTKDVVNGIYSFGRDSSVWESLLTQDKVLFQFAAYRLGYPDINQQLTTQYLTILDKVGDRPPLNASLSLKKNSLSIKKERPGLSIDIPHALTKLQNYDLSIDGQTLQLPSHTLSPSITKKDIAKLWAPINRIVDKPVVVQAGQFTTRLETADLINCLRVIKSSDPRQPAQSIPTLTFDSGDIDRVAARIVYKIDADPQPRIVQGNTVVVAGKDGAMIDGTETKISLLTLLLSRMYQLPQGNRPLVLPRFTVKTVSLPKTPQTNLFEGQLAAYKNNQPVVTFSFSGVPNSTYTPAILDALVKNRVSGLFLLTGRNVVTYPDIAKQISKSGQRLGLSTYSYHDVSGLSLDKLTREINNSRDVIAQATGMSVNIFQAPYNHLTSAQISQINQLGYEVLPGTLDALDWANIPEPVIVKEVSDRVQPGSIIMFHALNHTTSDVIPAIVAALHQKGYEVN